MTAVFARTCVSQCFSSRRAQTKRVIEFALSEQTCVGCYNGAAKLHRNAAVKIYAPSIVLRFTRRVGMQALIDQAEHAVIMTKSR